MSPLNKLLSMRNIYRNYRKRMVPNKTAIIIYCIQRPRKFVKYTFCYITARNMSKECRYNTFTRPQWVQIHSFVAMSILY